jgi:NTP pyrophosphatase (non-canonical NTP hydrolase)
MNEETRETLIILQEELIEAAQVISKIFRFGPDQIVPNTDTTNLHRLTQELGDVQAMLELLLDLNVGITQEGLDEAKRRKFEKLKQWSNLTINK